MLSLYILLDNGREGGVKRVVKSSTDTLSLILKLNGEEYIEKQD